MARPYNEQQLKPAIETNQMFHMNLVEQCKANDRKAQLKLYRQYCDGMYCVAMRFLKNTDDAEDILQEAFIKAFQKIEQFKGEVTFGAWLKRIVINKCLDFLKSKKEQRVEFKDSYMEVAEDDDWTVEDGITIEMVQLAMDQLPDTYVHVVKLYLLEGYDHNEISQILNITGTTCRTRLRRGKGILKELLKEKRYGTGS